MVDIFRYGKDDMSKVFKRTQLDDSDYISTVDSIVKDVRNRGDEAVFEYCKKFDRQDIDASNILVTDEEIKRAYDNIDSALLSSIRKARENVLQYHSRQREKFHNEFFAAGSNGESKLGWIYRPLARVGLYVPGGKASYPSTVLMTALPAKAAGVKEIVVVTPNISNPAILVACKECGIDKIYKVGGAQAIAALAYGTQTIPRVDLIAGPGNVFVTLAKKQVFGHVAIDMIAGPSEILVIADGSADARLVAADLLSQAEHDELAASILVTTSKELAFEVDRELERQTALLSRSEIMTKSLKSNGAIIVVENMSDAVAVADAVAPEHLEICAQNAEEIAAKLSNAGAIFVGNNSPEPLGDYFAGPSHVLPTSGSARYSSVLSVDTFMKKISYIQYSKQDLLEVADDVIRFAESEGLTAHANAVRLRKQEK